MTVDKSLQGRSFLKELDWSADELTALLDLAAELKRAKAKGGEHQALKGRNFALVFEKSSTRTRCSFEVAAHDQGANVTFIGPTGSHLGAEESLADTRGSWEGSFTASPTAVTSRAGSRSSTPMPACPCGTD